MTGKRRVRPLVAVALLLAACASPSYADAQPPDPASERPSTVVVHDDGFQWIDAGVGAVAALAATLLVLGLVLALRADRGGDDTSTGARVSAEERTP